MFASPPEEAKYINKSLTFLEQVVIALIDKSRDHVPYRSSKLTNVLKVCVLMCERLRPPSTQSRTIAVVTGFPGWKLPDANDFVCLA